MSSRNCSSNYKGHLEKCFKYIFNNPTINAKCHSISGAAKRAYNKLKTTRSNADWALKIEPEWIIPIEKDRNFQNSSAFLLIGGIIRIRNFRFTRYTFSVSIVTKNDIVRRFHFDVDTGDFKILKPICHMQFGGKAHETNSYPNLNYPLDPLIEKPRFPFPPIDFVLLFDLLLRQFNTVIGRKFVEEHNWKKLVKESEKYRLRDYYVQIQQYFNNINKEKNTLFEKLCY